MPMTTSRTWGRAVALLALLTAPLFAADTDRLPIDKEVTVKKLPNGLTYYIRQNKKPENRAQFRLVVNAGSILETELQRGLAHFIEHMAFNGTKNFQKNELVNFLERIGMQFGADLNAYTSFDETVYQLEIPMDKPEVLEKGLQILEDWAHQVSFDAPELEKERGVVVEEWRTIVFLPISFAMCMVVTCEKSTLGFLLILEAAHLSLADVQLLAGAGPARHTNVSTNN